MEFFQGKAASEGIAVGKIAVLNKKNYKIAAVKIEDADAQLARFMAAKVSAKRQLQTLYDKAVKAVGSGDAALFKAHQMILDDVEFNRAIENMIRTQMVNAEYAVNCAGDKFAKMFAQMDDEYMKARAADMRDIAGRLVRNLCGSADDRLDCDVPVIVIADDLSPSETMQLDRDKILAFVTVHGSVNSHTAILARVMNIPAIVSVPLNIDMIKSGMEAAVDGFSGKVCIEPSDEIKRRVLEKLETKQAGRQRLENLKGFENVTRGGRKIDIYANAGNIGDINAAILNDAGGVGLFRSEFLYIGRSKPPSEEEQFEIYKQAAQMMDGKKVIIRTMDIGADKQADYLNIGYEENPALGYRAIRICLSQPEIFKVQLRALFRAAAYGNISIMYPMITSVDEVVQIKAIVSEVKRELSAAGIFFRDDVEEGIMVETPAAALMTDELAAYVDFFSIGTNDLTQYTLAVDRQNQKLEPFYNAHHKAVLKLVKMTVDNAHAAGKWVGICGELGADTALTKSFLEMGVDELSVVPSMVLKIRKTVREME